MSEDALKIIDFLLNSPYTLHPHVRKKLEIAKEDLKQPNLFAQPKHEGQNIPNNPKSENIREKTAEWIKKNPKIAALFLELARTEAKAGRKFGINALAEQIRWKYKFEYKVGDFKICNDFRPYIARWLIAQDPTLEPFMKFKKVKY